MINKVEIFGVNTSKLPVLSNEEKNQLLKDIKNGSKEAREKYSRKGHMDFLVNCRISEIINKKLEIESRLHIKQAENESYNHSR